MRQIAILMPVFNKLEYTKKSLNSIFELISVENKNQELNYQVIVTDDGSTDGTEQWIKNNHSYVHIVKGDGDLWWSGGINRAAKYAVDNLKSDFLLLWNNDIIPAADYFSELSKIALTADHQTIIGSKVYFSDKPERIHAYGCFYNPRNGVKYPYAYNEKDSLEYGNELLCDWLPGMGTLLSSNIAVSLNFWDAENFPQYHGDSDFTWRAKKSGYIIKVVPQLKIWNNTENTGNNYPTSFKMAYDALISIRSDYNIKTELLFYKIHGEGVFWIYGFIQKYFFFIYGFIKRKILASLKTK